MGQAVSLIDSVKGIQPAPKHLILYQENIAMENSIFMKRPYLHHLDKDKEPQQAEHKNQQQHEQQQHQNEDLKQQPVQAEEVDDFLLVAEDFSSKPLQEDDNHKAFFLGIGDGGLDYMYAKYAGLDPKRHYHGKTKHPKHVVVVGAGTSGLAAAYELSQAGHEVTILEMQHRVGGRTKTITEPFTRGLHVEGGAMRLPGTGKKDWKGPSHFMTDHYMRLFEVETRPFQNINTKCFQHIYGHENITLKDWVEDNGKWSDRFWPGWDANIPKCVKASLNITGIDSYYEKTLEPVKEELKRDHSIAGWNRWVAKWSQLSVDEFFRTDLHQEPGAPKLRPWPERAMQAYTVSKYNPFLSISMVEFLRDELGGWWEEPMYTPVKGMEELAWAFTRRNTKGWNPDVCLEKSTRFGIQVQKVEVVTPERRRGVRITGKNVSTGENFTISGDSVVITVPIPILRQMDVPLTFEQERALNFVSYGASTKVLLQYRKRFWQEDFGIQGGMTRTNLPIGQVHYPDWEGSGISPESRGILVCYTWTQDALLMGSMEEDDAIKSAVQQIEKIHPGSSQLFEVGAVQSWFNDSSAQGAFAFLRPGESVNALPELIKPNHPIYLAGEALSWSNGWIQGALESGLRAAFQFYIHNEKDSFMVNELEREQ